MPYLFNYSKQRIIYYVDYYSLCIITNASIYIYICGHTHTHTQSSFDNIYQDLLVNCTFPVPLTHPSCIIIIFSRLHPRFNLSLFISRTPFNLYIYSLHLPSQYNGDDGAPTFHALPVPAQASLFLFPDLTISISKISDLVQLLLPLSPT